MAKNILIVVLCVLLAVAVGLFWWTGGVERFMAYMNGTPMTTEVEEQVHEEMLPDAPVNTVDAKKTVRTVLAALQNTGEPVVPHEFPWTMTSDQVVLVPGFHVYAPRLSTEAVTTLRRTLIDAGFTVSNNNAADGPGASLAGYEKGTEVCRVMEVYTTEGDTMWTDATISCGDTSLVSTDPAVAFLAQIKFATAVEFSAVEPVDFTWWRANGEETPSGAYVSGVRMVSPALHAAATPNFPQMFADWGWTPDETNTRVGEFAGVLGFTKDAMVCQLIGNVVSADANNNTATVYTVYCGFDTDRPVQRRVVTPTEELEETTPVIE